MNRLCITLTAALLFTALLPATSRAQQLFNFVQDETMDILATLQVLSLPADEVSDFGELTFTKAGDEIFGFGEGLYAGEFDNTNSDDATVRALDIAGGELRTVGSGPSEVNFTISDLNAPPSTVGSDGADLRIFFRTSGGRRRSRISLSGFPAEIGAFLAVPEPGTIVLLAFGLPVLLTRRGFLAGGTDSRPELP